MDSQQQNGNVPCDKRALVSTLFCIFHCASALYSICTSIYKCLIHAAVGTPCMANDDGDSFQFYRQRQLFRWLALVTFNMNTYRMSAAALFGFEIVRFEWNCTISIWIVCCAQCVSVHVCVWLKWLSESLPPFRVPYEISKLHARFAPNANHCLITFCTRRRVYFIHHSHENVQSTDLQSRGAVTFQWIYPRKWKAVKRGLQHITVWMACLLKLKWWLGSQHWKRNERRKKQTQIMSTHRLPHIWTKVILQLSGLLFSLLRPDLISIYTAEVAQYRFHLDVAQRKAKCIFFLSFPLFWNSRERVLFRNNQQKSLLKRSISTWMRTFVFN